MHARPLVFASARILRCAPAFAFAAIGCAALLSLALSPSRARAGDILFVADSASDLNIPGVLTAEGHTVTTRMGDFAGGNASLLGGLSGYDCVVWSATGSGYGDTHANPAVFTNLTSYVSGGGRVFVTGYDSIASPTDTLLIQFLGGTGSIDGGTPGAITMTPNSLNTGEVDIRGVTPSGYYGDQDTLTGLMPGTVAVAPYSGGGTWTLRTLGAGEIAYVSEGAPGGSTHPSWTNTSAGGAGAYNAALRNFTSVVLGGAPIVRFTAPGTVDEGMDITIDVMVEDREGDPTTWSWDLDGDGTYGEMAGATSHTILGTTTDGPQTITVGVRASDGTDSRERRLTITVDNVDPEITSMPPAGPAFIGSEWRYDVTWNDPAGMRDLPIFSVPGAPSGMTVSRGGAVTWTPTTAQRDMTFPITLQLDDGDGGVVTQMFDVMVSNNRAPGLPVPMYPIMRERITETMPTLVTENAVDPDGDRLSYFFRIDSASSFTSMFLIESPEVVETAGGTTGWTVPTILRPGIWYWQVKASDGVAETEWQMAAFIVSDGEADAGTTPVDGGPRPDAGTIAPPPGRRDAGGCGCRVAGTDERPRGLALGAFALVLAIALRRRRR